MRIEDPPVLEPSLFCLPCQRDDPLDCHVRLDGHPELHMNFSCGSSWFPLRSLRSCGLGACLTRTRTGRPHEGPTPKVSQFSIKCPFAFPRRTSAMGFDTLITNGRLVTATDTYPGDIAISGGKIEAIGKNLPRGTRRRSLTPATSTSFPAASTFTPISTCPSAAPPAPTISRPARARRFSGGLQR